MAKLTGPILSLDATGPLSNELTYQRRRQQPIAIARPTHPDARTLPQIYQRARYYDAVQSWLTLTPAQKATYAKNARPLHMTGMALYIRTYLTTTPDLAGWWHLDETAGAINYDLSAKARHFTIYGATPVPGQLALARRFTTNAHVLISTPGRIAPTLPGITITAWLRFRSTHTSLGMIVRHTPPVGFRLQKTGPIWNFIVDVTTTSGTGTKTSTTTLTPEVWYHVAFTYTPGTIALWLNGTLDASTPWTGALIDSPTLPISIGRNAENTNNPLSGDVDDPRIYTRALTARHIYDIANNQLP